MIMPFDLFGYELYQYTFRMKCEEISELELENDATRIFWTVMENIQNSSIQS